MLKRSGKLNQAMSQVFASTEQDLSEGASFHQHDGQEALTLIISEGLHLRLRTPTYVAYTCSNAEL